MFISMARSFSRHWQPAGMLVLVAALVLPAVSCAQLVGRGSNDSQATISALQATINAPTATPLPTATPPPTAVPTQAPPTPTQALPPTQAPQPQPVSAQPQQPTPQAQQQGNDDLEERIRNANVLLYEDIAGYSGAFRYIAAAIQRLGIRRGDNFVDVGDAGGRLMDNMLRGTAPNGKPWDLIIISDEYYTDIQGDFFEALEGILAQGKTKVILEHYFLDEIDQGTAKPVLLRCGVNVREWNYGAINDLDLIVLEPNHPSVSEIVKITGFRKSDTWAQFGDDVGDLMSLSTTGDAKMILGTRPLSGDDTQYGALVECADGNMILQTSSTHNYLDESMVSLWANNIHYMLRKQLTGE